MEPHPVFHTDLADGPESGCAWRVTAADGTGLRVATWAGGPRGTVVIFPGRNEHVEKYGRVARDLALRGWSSAAVDWRGQGHSDRASAAGILGHVDDFAHYQRDADALLTTARRAGLPEPFHLLAHSMGGAIGLRALARGLPVRSAAFSAPMWGLRMAPHLRPLARGISAIGRVTGMGLREVPVGRRESYLSVTPFEENALTSCPDTYAWMVAQAIRDPRLALGRPTLIWLNEALAEIRRLALLPPPAVPAYVAVAGEETVVDNAATGRLAARWPDVRLDLYEGARHEILMERDVLRDRFLDAIDAHFASAEADAPAASG
jgi:lysophospholipase